MHSPSHGHLSVELHEMGISATKKTLIPKKTKNDDIFLHGHKLKMRPVITCCTGS